MGAGQSKEVEPQLTQQLVQRLRALQVQSEGRHEHLESDEDCGYVQVVNEKFSKYSPAPAKLSLSTLEEWEKQLLQDPKNRLALAAFSNASPTSVLTTRSPAITDAHVFNTTISLEGSPITNQRASGRCWLFAATNVFRVALMRHHNLKDFELSQAYLFYWDKLEKANFFLEQILDTADEPLDGRLVQQLLAGPVSDGGQWDMVANLVRKYGLVPHALYPDAFAAMNSGDMDHLITSKLREQAIALRHLVNTSSSSTDLKTAIASAKGKMLREIHLMVTLTLGPPPSPDTPFKWDYYDAEGTFHSLSTTPRQFAAELSSPKAIRACASTDVNELCCLVNDPRNKYNSLLTVDRLGNMVGAPNVRYVNVDMPTMKAACISMLQRNQPIFFGSDVGQSSSSTTGVMDTHLHAYHLAFPSSSGAPPRKKSLRLATGESAPTHAMVITAVHLSEKKEPIRWRVQNSWGEAAGDKGWFVMTDEWFSEFVFEAVVDKRAVGGKVWDVLKQEAKVLPLWDPMGTLA